MTDHTTHARSARNYMHLAAGKVARGDDLTAEELDDIKVVHAWAEAVIDRTSLDIADIYNRVFGGKQHDI